jgi:hypothetical protein
MVYVLILKKIDSINLILRDKLTNLDVISYEYVTNIFDVHILANVHCDKRPQLSQNMLEA